MTEQEPIGTPPTLLPPAGKPRATIHNRNAPPTLFRLVLWGTNADGQSAAWVEGDFERARPAIDIGLAALGGQIDSFAVFSETGRRVYSRNTRQAVNWETPISVTALAGLSHTGDQARSKRIKPKTGTYRRK